MTKKFHNDIVIKKKKHHFFKKLGLFVLFVMCLCLIIFLADILSTALTAGKFSFASIKSNNIKIKEKSLYAVTLGKSDNKFQAYNISAGASVLGAGGFVWEENEEYIVIANIYDSFDDATKIANGLKNGNYDVSVLEIKLNKIKLNSKELSKENRKDVVSALNRLYKLYEDLYELGINIDTKNVTFVQGGSLVNGYKSECKIINNMLTSINSNLNLDYITKINNTYIYVIEILDSLVFKLLRDDNLNSIVKSAEIEVVYNIYNLICSL